MQIILLRHRETGRELVVDMLPGSQGHREKIALAECLAGRADPFNLNPDLLFWYNSYRDKWYWAQHWDNESDSDLQPGVVHITSEVAQSQASLDKYGYDYVGKKVRQKE